MQDAAENPAPNLADRVHRAALEYGDRPALHWREQSITWSEMDAAVDAAARGLAAVAPHTRPGDPPPRVAIALPNTPDFVIGLLGALRAGLVAVPVNPGFTAPELRHVLADSGTSVLLGTDRIRGLAAEVSAGLPALTAVHGAPPRPAAEAPEPTPHPRRGGDDLAVLLYTSGTEGHPKGAMLSHRALLANHEQVDRIEPPVVGPTDTVLLALPLFHAYGLNSGLGAVVHHGATGVLLDEPGPTAGLDEIARHRVSVLIGVPSMFLAWAGAATARAATASVRIAVCGAAPLDPAVAARFTATTGHPVHVGYGLTETAPVLTSTLVGGVAKAGSIGRPLPGVRLRLVDAAGADLWRDGLTVPDDDPDELDISDIAPGTDPGQIVVAGPNLFAGYWPDGRDGPDADGWWGTGDIAYADSDGDLFLVDRLGELILVNGFNVYPHEVELVLAGHPGVAESAVLGVPHPRTGETVRAYVVPAPGRPVTGEELLTHCARNLARFKCPTVVEFVDALPHSAIGKVRKTQLRSATPAGPPADADTRTEVTDVH
ncbi:AMP-binding protein [Micromonospora sp. WMMD710]|uniref:AMP-binding protein n=1 Tax=Micromonospora sp. WMMD710 TaxID=3016085 RepID=UPI00241773D0|nr:AMP-binding protein [Micromonospora sp. WMMD710]MDG4761815.1 AMP-binding protein [Micromonospora sp. WMMD710]